MAASSMKDLASCFGEHAVCVSDVLCFGSVSVSCPLLGAPEPDSRAASSVITALYRVRLISSPTSLELLIRVSWSRSHMGPTFFVGVDSSSSSSSPMTRHLLPKKKGSRSFTTSQAAFSFPLRERLKTAARESHALCVLGGYLVHKAVSLSWDVAFSKYTCSPEPVTNFYLFVSVDGEPALSLRDSVPTVEFSLLSRKE
uniref:Uncharacterized protein n=1 Tax=Ananas comosus var. bracteatus TaxID=296719 RepID=A0A6V7PV28_ANACO|nr:unnamed protein product [Ananas comosus var. bracteatus]